jgi:hypothetical protein
MKVTVLKPWAGHDKGDTAEIEDKSVIAKGIKIGLFKDPKAKPEAPEKPEK